MSGQWLILAMSLLTTSSVLSSINDYQDNEVQVEDDAQSEHFTNEWVVHVEGGTQQAEAIADEMGFSYQGVVPGLDDTYIFVKDDHPSRHKRDASHLTQQMVQDERILWSEQQQVKIRTKRDLVDAEVDPEFKVNQRKRPYLDFPEGGVDYSEENPSNDYYDNSQSEYYTEEGEAEEVIDRGQRGQGLQLGPVLSFLLKVKAVSEVSNAIDNLSSPKNKVHRLFNDEHWSKQWYMHHTHSNPNEEEDNTGVDAFGVAVNHTEVKRTGIQKLIYRTVDMNVLPCYAENLTGHGIRVSILDDGLEHTHPDIKKNYDGAISLDLNGNDTDPTPQYNGDNAHGTRCAGEVAMEANNGICGVGVAFNARIGGVRLLDGPVTDRTESTAVGHASHLVDIYSASWGPKDDGTVVDGPGRLVKQAFINGITKGRNGKGNIFVWASGNGGGQGDSCSCDGYVNSIYTLAVSSVSQNGRVPWYGEKCAATFTTTYSSGSIREQMIVATDLKGKCTDRHSGTSAAAPIAAGVIALLLESNPELTWRDVQHIVVLTSRAKPLMAKSLKGWKMNAAGFFVNTRFGFGLMDGHAMVRAARTWVTVPEQKKCTLPFDISDQSLVSGESVKIKIPMKCDEVQYLEHTVLQVNINSTIRGSIEAYLESPSGTKVQILYARYKDKSNLGYKNWPILSVYTWNENPNGDWTLEVLDTCKNCPPGKIGDLALTVYGTTEKPPYFKERAIDKLADKLEEAVMNDHSEENVFLSLFSMRNILKQVWE